LNIVEHRCNRQEVYGVDQLAPWFFQKLLSIGW
jgi:hypothetical protein